MSNLDHPSVIAMRSALEYALTAFRKICDGSMFTPESERAVAEKRINEAIAEYDKACESLGEQ